MSLGIRRRQFGVMLLSGHKSAAGILKQILSITSSCKPTPISNEPLMADKEEIFE